MIIHAIAKPNKSGMKRLLISHIKGLKKIIDDKKTPREELSVVENILLQYRIMIKTEKPPIIEKD